MPLEIELDEVEYEDLVESLKDAGIPYKLSTRRGFDAVAAATLVIQSVAAIGPIITPIILHFLNKKKDTPGQVTINAIVVNGMSDDQVKEVLRGLIRDDRPDRPS